MDNRLPDEAIVIRGGINEPDLMRQSAEDEFERSGQYALSVAADARMTLAELAAANKTPHSQIRKTTAGALRAAGFEVTPPKGSKRHSNLIIPQPITDDVWSTLDEILDPPERNPRR